MLEVCLCVYVCVGDKNKKKGREGKSNMIKRADIKEGCTERDMLSDQEENRDVGSENCLFDVCGSKAV